MARKYISGSRLTWEYGKTTSFVTVADGAVCETTPTVSTGVDFNRYIGINASEQVASALPQYPFFARHHDFGNFPYSAPSRPIQNGDIIGTGFPIRAWEPTQYWGKVGGIVTRPRTCLIIVDTDAVVGNGLASDTTIADAIAATVAGPASDLGVHIYLMKPSPQEYQWLLWGLPHGGITADSSGEQTFTLPEYPPVGDLLVISIAPEPTGFGPYSGAGVFAAAPFDQYPEAGWYAFQLNGCSAVPFMAGSYMAFSGEEYAEQSGMLAADRDLVESYAAMFPTFRHVAHPIGSSLPIFYVTDAGTDPVEYESTPPGSFPTSASAYWTATASGLSTHQLGSEIDVQNYSDDLASAVLADIEDFYS